MVALEDYFDWYEMIEDKKVHFAKIKLKGQVRVWQSSIEEHINRLGQPLIVHWVEMKLKLQEKYLPLDFEESMYEVSSFCTQ